MSRLVTEDDKVFVYHSLENSRILHGTELQCIEVEPPVSWFFTLLSLVDITMFTVYCHVSRNHFLSDSMTGAKSLTV